VGHHLALHPAVKLLGRNQSDARVSVFLVVPGEKIPAKGPGIFHRTETSWKLRTILEGLELGLRIGIVVAPMRPAMGFGDPQIR
jgi:hypothetical protein